MSLDIVLWVLAALAMVGLAGLVARKLPVVKSIDTSALVELKQRQVKRALVESRLRRRFARWLRAGVSATKPTLAPLTKLGARLRAFEERAVAELAHRRSKAFTAHELLERGRAALASGEIEAAEQAFLEVLRHDAHDPRAYDGLGELYLGERDYEQAQEVYKFLAKRAPSSAAYLGLARVAAGQGQSVEARAAYTKSLGLGDTVAARLEFARVLHGLGDTIGAQDQLAAARALEPANPKILDFYIELSIVNGRLSEAQAALDTLREVNPDNQKIPDFVQAVRELARTQKPKRTATSRRATNFGLPVRGSK